MRCLIAICFIVLARHCESGALKCSPGTEGPCAAEQESKDKPSQITTDDASAVQEMQSEVECLAGTEWESNCHFCRCSDSGVAECLRQDSCDQIIFTEPVRCQPGTSFQRDCNTCVCLDNGLGLCSLDACRRSSTPKKFELIQGRECAPGSSWSNQCNSCRCNADGYGICSDEACTEHIIEPKKECAPKTMWKNECNTCWCTSDGKPMCTRMECITNNTPEKSELIQGRECAPGSTWSNQCNSCRCNADGYAICSDEACAEHINEPKKDCVPNTTWKNECYTCWCTSDGKPMCTRVECITNNTPKKSELIQGRDCAPGSTWSNQCNSCRCNADGYAICSDEACAEHIDEPKKDCAPKTMWKNECNTCWCTSDGKPMCTKMGCISYNNFGSGVTEKLETKGTEIPETFQTITNKIEGNKVRRAITCKPNQEFKSDCNLCKCSQSGHSYTCTHNECLEGDTGTDADVEVFMENDGVDHIERHSVCKPRNSFYVSCNICRCNDFGTDYACTNKLCPLPADVEVFHELKETKPVVPIVKASYNGSTP
ncbi:balbiani ring protein 3 isoform X7 [Bombyx mori]|uniref:Pacifastin domain-containing protein n=1 Tax=Bombyx mori TaxID=7091 RepID=A0A8R2M4R0_BOMMO|nr:balbiani ring protein 3 isoform X7 [Bombyx mori]